LLGILVWDEKKSTESVWELIELTRELSEPAWKLSESTQGREGFVWIDSGIE